VLPACGRLEGYFLRLPIAHRAIICRCERNSGAWLTCLCQPCLLVPVPQKGASASLTEGPRGVAHLGAVISQIVPPTYEPQYTDLLRCVAAD
jgi:hypothetical protein